MSRRVRTKEGWQAHSLFQVDPFQRRGGLSPLPLPSPCPEKGGSFHPRLPNQGQSRQADLAATPPPQPHPTSMLRWILGIPTGSNPRVQRAEENEERPRRPAWEVGITELHARLTYFPSLPRLCRRLCRAKAKQAKAAPSPPVRPT